MAGLAGIVLPLKKIVPHPHKEEAVADGVAMRGLLRESAKYRKTVCLIYACDVVWFEFAGCNAWAEQVAGACGIDRPRWSGSSHHLQKPPSRSADRLHALD